MWGSLGRIRPGMVRLVNMEDPMGTEVRTASSKLQPGLLPFLFSRGSACSTSQFFSLICCEASFINRNTTGGVQILRPVTTILLRVFRIQDLVAIVHE
jgi:hypothetical protein